MRHTPNRRPRGGFTLVELLVACALTVLIMAVLATAFQAGLSTFSHLKSTVGLSEQLRAAETVMRRDLEATHLETGDGTPVKVSDSKASFTRGYLEVIQGSAPKQNYNSSKLFYDNMMSANHSYVIEGEEDGVSSARATDHALFFTSKLRGNSTQEVFLGVAPSQVSGQSLSDYVPANSPTSSTAVTIATEWAELGYFLKPSALMSVSDDTNAPPLKLHTLIRRQKVLVTSGTSLPVKPAMGATNDPADWWNDFPETSISTQPQGMPLAPSAGVNDAGTVKNRNNRSYILFTNGNTTAPTSTPILNVSALGGASQGTDVLVTNVVSMQIRVMDSTGKFQDQLPNAVVSPAPPPVTGTATAFDTAAPGTAQARAIQIRLRVYDTKNHLTRQMTMTFDL